MPASGSVFPAEFAPTSAVTLVALARMSRWRAPEVTAALAEAAVASATRNGDLGVALLAEGWLLHGLNAMGQGPKGVPRAIRALDETRERGLAEAGGRLRVELGRVAHELGDDDTALALLMDGVIGDASTAELTVDARLLGMLARARFGERQTEPESLAPLPPHPGEAGALASAEADRVIAARLRRGGRLDVAARYAQRGLRTVLGASGAEGTLDPVSPHLAVGLSAELVMALADSGAVGKARRVAGVAERWEVRPATVAPLGRMRIALAAIAAPADHHRALDELWDVARLLEAHDLPGLRAECHGLIAQLCEHRGEFAEALAALRRAHTDERAHLAHTQKAVALLAAAAAWTATPRARARDAEAVRPLSGDAPAALGWPTEPASLPEPVGLDFARNDPASTLPLPRVPGNLGSGSAPQRDTRLPTDVDPPRDDLRPSGAAWLGDEADELAPLGDNRLNASAIVGLEANHFTPDDDPLAGPGIGTRIGVGGCAEPDAAGSDRDTDADEEPEKADPGDERLAWTEDEFGGELQRLMLGAIRPPHLALFAVEAGDQPRAEPWVAALSERVAECIDPLLAEGYLPYLLDQGAVAVVAPQTDSDAVMHWVRGVHSTLSARWPELVAELLPSGTLRVELRRLDFDRTAREHLSDLGLCRVDHRSSEFAEQPAVPWSPATPHREPRVSATSAEPADRHLDSARAAGAEPLTTGAPPPTMSSERSAIGTERPNPDAERRSPSTERPSPGSEPAAEPDDSRYGRHCAPDPSASPSHDNSERPEPAASPGPGTDSGRPRSDPGTDTGTQRSDAGTDSGTGGGRRRRARSLSELSFAELLAGALDAYREG